MPELLDGRVAVISAAASGMGRASARRFVEEGATVIALDIDEQGGESLAGECGDGAGSLDFRRVDMTHLDEIQAVLDDVRETYGALDILFNHVGAPGPRAFDYTVSDWDRSVALNLTAPVLTTQMAFPLLEKATNGASVIYTASIGGMVASVNSPVYSAMKSGVIGFMRAVAAFGGPHNIRANAICPGLTDTPMLPKFYGGEGEDAAVIETRLAAAMKVIPLGRFAKPDDISELAVFLASDKSSYITGVPIPIDGGYVAT
jgi:NAD(P)-dependent dehydrogenase (short-subunit alcohol dehydrogenase family)